MDPQADVFYGPGPVQKNGTVTVPVRLLREVGIEPGDGHPQVHWVLNRDIPGTLVMIPDELMARTTDDTLENLRKKSG